jgi:hypothetical protein
LVTGQTVFMVQASDAVHPRNSTDWGIRCGNEQAHW